MYAYYYNKFIGLYLKMKKLFIGVDPGLDGAISCYDSTINDIVYSEKFVTTKYGVITTIHPFQILDQLATIRRNYKISEIYISIEEVHSYPTDGPKNAFNFGLSTGILLTCLSTLTIHVTTINPETWQKCISEYVNFNYPSKYNKKKISTSMELFACNHLFPLAIFSKTLYINRGRLPDSGKMDAALIAYTSYLLYAKNNV